jgi:DAK2 domain fusion protein YloV
MGVDVLEALDAAAIRRWSEAAVGALRRHRGEIDRLNVYPVADRDTGTNMLLTMAAGDDALRASDADAAGTALAELARGAVLGAQGNSGVILSQILRGFADTAAGRSELDAGLLADALAVGSEQARASVAEPVEGTILTVMQAAAQACAGIGSLPQLARRAAEVADEALAATTAQLEVLARAGVVDAGGRGLALVLHALAATVSGAPADARAATEAVASAADISFDADSDAGGVAESGRYEVQYLVDSDEAAVTRLRRRLQQLGDSVAVVGTGSGTWNVHVHVDDVGVAIEAGVEAGRPHAIKVVALVDRPAGRPERTEHTGQATHIEHPGHVADGDATAVVAVVPGDGLAHLFSAEGVTVVGGRRPSVDEVLAAIRASGAASVVLLPNAEPVTEVAELAAAAARADGLRATVVPTRSPVQGLAAVAVHDPRRRFDDDVVAMAEAAAATRFAEVAIAQEESLTSIGICQAGDVLGFIDGEVVEIGHGTVAVVLSLIDRFLGVGAELMTVLVGADAPNGIGELVVEHVRRRSPLTEVTVYRGGQPRYPIVIGVE